jgi:hypothetical protein
MADSSPIESAGERHRRLRRGLLRLWLVLSGVFVLAVAIWSFNDIRREFDRAQLLHSMSKRPDMPLPVECSQARGVEDRDYIRAMQSRGELYRLRPNEQTCWYQPDRLRALYPEYAGLSDAALAERLYSAVGIPLKDPPAPFALGLRVALLAIGAPLMTLAIASGLWWAIGGFLRQRS